MVVRMTCVNANTAVAINKAGLPQQPVIDAWYRLDMNFVRLGRAADLKFEFDWTLLVDDLRLVPCRVSGSNLRLVYLPFLLLLDIYN